MVDSEEFVRTLPDFPAVVATCRAEPSRGGVAVDERHMVPRTFTRGDGKDRVFAFLCLVKDDRQGAGAVYWFAHVMHPEGGDVNGDLVPLANWSVAAQLAACECRTLITGLEPHVREASDAEGYFFIGPTQISEPTQHPAQKGAT